LLVHIIPGIQAVDKKLFSIGVTQSPAENAPRYTEDRRKEPHDPGPVSLEPLIPLKTLMPLRACPAR
jgi:hypothetical protein